MTGFRPGVAKGADPLAARWEINGGPGDFRPLLGEVGPFRGEMGGMKAAPADARRCFLEMTHYRRRVGGSRPLTVPREPEPLSGTCRPPPAASLRRERAPNGGEAAFPLRVREHHLWAADPLTPSVLPSLWGQLGSALGAGPRVQSLQANEQG